MMAPAKLRRPRQQVVQMAAPPPKWFCRLCWRVWEAARSSSTFQALTATRSRWRKIWGSRQCSRLRACIQARSRRCGWSGYSASPPLSWGSGRQSAEGGSGHSLQVVVYNQPGLAAKSRPRGRMAVSQLLDPGAGLGPRLRRYPVRPTPWAYDEVPGEGSIPVPLPPPSTWAVCCRAQSTSPKIPNKLRPSS